MKRFLAILAFLAVPALAQETASEKPAAPKQPAAPAAAPATSAETAASEKPAAPAAAPARPAPGRVLLPRGPKWDALPPEEKEHVRRMAEFKAARDAAEQDLIRLDDRAQARREKILAENEEAKTLHDRIAELKEEYAAATNALETIYRTDEELQAIAAEIEPARKIVEANQHSLNQEVVAAMHKRMAKQREALEAEKPAPAPVEETPESLGMDPEAYSNLVRRVREPVVPGRTPPNWKPNPDLKPPAPAGRRPGERPEKPLALPSPETPAPAAK